MCAALFIVLAPPSMNLPVFSATLLATLYPVFASPVNATLAVLATAEKAPNNGLDEAGTAASTGATSCGTGDEWTNATTAHNTKIEVNVFILNWFFFFVFRTKFT